MILYLKDTKDSTKGKKKWKRKRNLLINTAILWNTVHIKEAMHRKGSYLYLKLAKMSCFLFIFSLLHNWRTGGQDRSCPVGRAGTHGREMVGKGHRRVNTV
jgi:hypothetical protein